MANKLRLNAKISNFVIFRPRQKSSTIPVVNLKAINNDTNALTVLQKRALHFMIFFKPRTHAVSLFISSKILPVNMLYFKTLYTLMNDIQ